MKGILLHFSLFKYFNFIIFQARDIDYIYYFFSINVLLLEIGLFELVVSKKSYGRCCLMR